MWSRFSKQIKWQTHLKCMCSKQSRVISSMNMHNAMLNLFQMDAYLTKNLNLLTNTQKNLSNFHMHICLFHSLNVGSSDGTLLKQLGHSKEIKRYKKGKVPKEEDLEDESASSSDSESDDETSDSESDKKKETFPDYPEDSHITSPYKQRPQHVTSTRCDTILRKSLKLKANEVLTAFFAGNIYVNDKKILKKNVKLKEGDYADIVLKNSEDKSCMRRVRVLKINETKTKTGKQAVLCRVWLKLFEADKKET